MKPLLARHALSQTALRVSDEMRPPRDLRDAGADPVYAVFSSQEDEEFLGLVAPRRFGISRERIFADLLARPAIEPAHPETPLTELLLRMESDGVDAVPVVDETGSYHGVVTLSTLLRTHLEREQQLLAKAQRLRTQADRERRRVQRWAARVDDLNRAFGKLLSLTGQMRSEQELLQGGIECLAEILDARFCAFLIVDGSGERTRFLHTGFTAEEVERVGTPPEGKGLLGVVLREGSSLRLTDRTRDPRSHGLPPGHPEMKTLLAVPVANKGQILGNLYMSEKKNGEAFTAEDEILAQGFANVLALAVASAMGQAERRRAEEQLAEAQKLESVGRLAAGVAHEINTPSQYVSDNLRFLEESFGDLEEALKAFSELIAAAESGSIGPELLDRVKEKANEVDLEYLVEEAPKAIQQSLEGIGRVTTIVRAMKSFAHPGVEEKTPTDVNEALTTTLTVARNEWKYVAELETDLDPSLPLVPCLPAEFNQVALNMIVNAAHAIADAREVDSEGKGRILIRTRRDGSWARIEIHDDGPGIPEEVRGKIFEPFFTTKEVGRGTGQGLAIARHVIVEKHAGRLDVETEVGSGTKFIVRLPLESAGEAAVEKS